MTAVERPTVAAAISDHREVVIAEVAYTVKDAAVFLGLSYFATQRLVASGKLRSRNTGARYIIPGAAIRDYLDGSDEPMKHAESA